MLGGGGAAGAGEGAAGCNDKNKNPTIECGEQERDEDIYEWCSMRLTTHMNASTRNPLVAPLTL